MKEWYPLIPIWIAIAVLAVVGLTGCSSIQNGDVKVSVWGIEEKKNGNEEIHLYLSHNKDYDGIIQEVYLEDGTVLVEYFENYSFDYHSDGDKNARRIMVTYPGEIKGADQTESGFAQLPQNKDGTAITNTGPYFNKWYQDKYETKGRITRHKRDNPTVWILRWKNGKVTWKIPENKERAKMGFLKIYENEND